MARLLSKNWIVAHSEEVDPISEAPKQFNVWAAISVVAATLKNHVYVKYGTFTIYPNSYIILTGPPGVGKGTAIHPVWAYPKKLNLVNVISDRITAPKIIERLASGFAGQVQIHPTSNGNGLHSPGPITMAKDGSATLIATELSTLLSSSDWMMTFLCDAWDRGEYYYDTKNSGSSTVKDMCCSLIGACVPDYIRKINKTATSDINAGFTARAIFVYAEEKSKNLLWPVSTEGTPRGIEMDHKFSEDLKQISQLKGEMTFDDSARLEFRKFKQSSYLKPHESDTDVILHFKSRMHVHVLKLATVFSCASRDSLVVTYEDMASAILCLRDVMKNLDRAFRGLGDSELAESTARVQTFIEHKGITTRNEILSGCHRYVTGENLDRILALLVNIQFCTGRSQGGKYIYTHVGSKPQVAITNSTVITSK